MSRAGSRDEREMLKKLRSARNTDSGNKICASVECPEYGILQPIANFYRNGKRGHDHYCATCRRAKSAQWRMDNPDYEPGPRTPRTDWELALSKAPRCADHRVPTTECGCAPGARLHKSPAHRAKIAAAMREHWAKKKKEE